MNNKYLCWLFFCGSKCANVHNVCLFDQAYEKIANQKVNNPLEP